MGGLDFTAVNSCKVLTKASMRIDSEYFQKKYAANARVMASPMKVRDVLNHRRPPKIKGLKLSRDFNYLEISRISPTGDYGTVTIAPDEVPDRADVVLHNGDVAVSSVRPNRNAVAYIRDAKRLVGTSGLVVLRALGISPEYLFAFTKTKHFAMALTRETTATMYPAVSAEDILDVPFVMPTPQFAQKVQEKVGESYATLLSAGEKHDSAEYALLRHLRLHEWQPRQFGQNITVKSFRNSFGALGRLDAEYYHPRYEHVEKKLRKFKVVRLQEICSAINYGTVPTSPYTDDGSGVPYIKGLNLKRGLVVTDKLDRIINTKALRPRYYTKEGDLLISQMGTVGNCGVVSGEQAGWVFASFTIRARIENQSLYPPHFLALYINAVAKPYYFLREIAQASVRQNTTLPIVRNMPVPVLPTAVQNSIDAKLQESHRLRARAQKLMDDARQAVEIAIEKGEKEALAFLKNCAK